MPRPKRQSLDTFQSQDDDSVQTWRSANGGHAMSMMSMAEELIPKFNGQDSTYTSSKWAQDIEENGEIFGWTDSQKLLVARRSLTGTAALWLRSEGTFRTWMDLQAAVLQEFPDTIDQKQIHEMMSSRKKNKNESCLEYMFIMKELGKRGKMPDYVTIEYIIDGIGDAEINKIMLYGVRTYGALKEKLKIYETFKKKSAMETRSSGSNKQTSYIPYEDERNVMTNLVTTMRCFSCGEKSHVSQECPYQLQGRKCFSCNSFGHISADCPLKKMAAGILKPRASTATAASAPPISQSGGIQNISDSIGNGYERHEQFDKVGTTDQRRTTTTDRVPKQVYFNSTPDDATYNDVQGEVYLVSTDVNMRADVSYSDDTEVGGTKPYDDQCEAAIGRSDRTATLTFNDGGDEFDVDVRDVNKPTYDISGVKKPLKNVKFCGKSKSACSLIDSGCDVNLMSNEFYNELGFSEYDGNTNITLTGLGSAKVQSYGAVTLDVTIDDQEYAGVTSMFYIVSRDSIPFKIILGNDFLKIVTLVMKDCSVWLVPKDDDCLRNVRCNGETTIYPRRILLKELAEVERQVDGWLEKRIFLRRRRLKLLVRTTTPRAWIKWRKKS